MIPTVMEGALRLRAADVCPALHSRLAAALSFDNPEYLARLCFGAKLGSTPRKLRFLEESNGEVLLPRGAVALLRDAAAQDGHALQWEDRRVSFEPTSVPLNATLHPYQQQASSALVKGQQGYAVVPCGGGKTVIGVAAVVATGQPALVIVHTRELVDQWRKAFLKFTGIETGIIAKGQIDVRHFTVATVQSLAAQEPWFLTTLGRDFGAVVVDELHHIPAVTFQRILPFLPARYRFGLTATPIRADGLTPMLALSLGPPRFRIGHDELVAAGYLVNPRVEPIHTGVHIHADTHAALLAGLMDSGPRNRLIVALVKQEVEAGHSVLVLSGRVEHCQDLAESLRMVDTEAVAITSQMADGERGRAMERFRDGSLKVVCATSLADEGLDISRLERLVLASPSRAEGRTIQRLGRLMRPHLGKATPVLFDLVDADDISRRQFDARKRAYRQVLGHKAVEHLRSGP